MNEVDGELDLRDYLDVLRRRWRWVFGTMALIVGLVALFSFTRDEVYRSATSVQILTVQNQSVFNVTQEELFRTALAELQYTTGSDFRAAVDEAAGRPVDLDSDIVRVASDEDTEDAGILLFVAEGTSPGQAQAGAEAAAQVYLDRRLGGLIGSFESRRQDDVDARDELRVARDNARAAIGEADAALAAELDPLLISSLQADRDLLVAELTPVIDGLGDRIGAYNAQIVEIDNMLSILREPESTARLLVQAELPSHPISPDVPRNLMIGAVVGLILGLILAILRDLLDPTAHDGAGLARLVDIPVMATIGEIRSDRGAPGRVRRYRDLSIKESSDYQVLLNSLWLSNADAPLQSIVFTSDRAEVGKTQTVVNLAQAEAARGTRVLVIDTDFVNPSVADRLGAESGDFGLADLLEGRVGVEQVAVPTGIENLHIVDSNGAEGGSELLRSDRLGSVLADLYASYDLILIDSPPTLSTSDSRLVASQADAVVVVYDPAQSRREELQRTIDLLRGARANLIGLVANRSRASHPVYLSIRER